MANLTFKVLSSPDATVLEAFREIWRRLGEPPGARLSYALADNVGATTVPLDEAEQNPPFAELLAADAAASRSLTVHVPLQGVTATVSVARPNPNEPPGFDTVNWNVQEQVGVETIARLSASVQRAFKPTALPAGPSRILGPELEEYYRRREESLGELERLAGKLIRETSEAHAAIRAELERDRQKLMREVDESEKQRQGQYVEQLSRLEQQRATLAKRESELDDRSRTHARRQLRSDLKRDLNATSQSFALTKDTARKRWPIHAAFMLLLGGSAWWTWHAVSTFEAMATSGSTPLVVAGYARLLLGALAFFGFVVYYIRWNDAWADRHASEEFRLKRLNLDVDRASWVVETALEWRDEKGSEMPAEVLDRLTAELFSESTNHSGRTRHPTEDLASRLLGASSSLRMQLPGIGEATIDRRGLRSLENRSGEDDGAA